MTNGPDASPPPRPQQDDDRESPTVMTPQTPKALGGNRLLKRVGVGGMGEVWLGQDIKLHRQVAIKVMLQDLIKTTPDAAARFYQEARAVAKLNHQNIIQIFQIGEEKGLLFFSMEWVDGESLQDYLKRNGPLETVAALEIALQMVDGLAFACQHQVIHRDVKPANVMLDRNGRVKITDFGLAKIQDSDLSLTSSGMSMGSPNYMSPEMAKGESVNHRADIYAVGITLYQMLTGSVPFTGPSATAVLLKHIQEPLPIPQSLEEKAGRFLVDIMRKMTEKDADLRYQTYETLRADIATALDRARGAHGTSAFQTTPINATSLAAAGRSTIHVEATPVSNPPTAGLPAVKGRSPFPFLLAVVGAVILALVVVGGIVGIAFSKKGSVPGAALLGGGNKITGQIFLKRETTIDLIAGQTVMLYTGGDRDRLMKLRSEMEVNQRAIDEGVTRLASLLEDIRAVSSSNERVAELKKELQERETKVAKIIEEGQSANAKLEGYRENARKFTATLKDFEEKGYQSYPITDPTTGASKVLSASPGQKDASVQYLQGLIRGFEEAAAQNKEYVAKLTNDLDSAKKAVEETKMKINGRGPSGDTRPVEEKRKEFKELFLKVQALQSARLESLKELDTFAATPAAEMKTDPDGKFVMNKIDQGSYILKAAYTTKALPSESRLPYRAVWLAPVDVKNNEASETKMTQDNVIVFTQKDALDRLAKPYDGKTLEAALNDFLADNYQKADNPGIESYAQAVMSR